MSSDREVRGRGFNDVGLDELAYGFELWVARSKQERFCGIEEGAADIPGRGQSVEFGDYGEEEFDCYLCFLFRDGWRGFRWL